MSRKVKLSVSGILALGALVAVPIYSSGADPTTSVSSWPPLSETTNIQGIVALPVSDGVARTATVTATEAVAAAEANGFPPEMRPGTPEVELRLTSFDAAGGNQVEPEVIVAGFSNRLAWVVMYHDSRADIHGPPMRPGVARPAAEDQSCILVFIVDATGAEADVIEIQQFCVDV